MFENPRRGRQARNCTTNVPKILDLKSSSEQIFFRKLSLGAPDKYGRVLLNYHPQSPVFEHTTQRKKLSVAFTRELTVYTQKLELFCTAQYTVLVKKSTCTFFVFKMNIVEKVE